MRIVRKYTDGFARIKFDFADGNAPILLEKRKATEDDYHRYFLAQAKRLFAAELLKYLHYRKCTYAHVATIGKDRIIAIERCKMKVENLMLGDPLKFFKMVDASRRDLLLIMPVKANVWNDKIKGLIKLSKKIYELYIPSNVAI